MRTYIPAWEKLGISRARYRELLNFCCQYDEWHRAASSLLGIRGKSLDGQPHGSGVGDPVYAAVERRNSLLAKIEIVERCALAVDGGIWFHALISNVCRGNRYEHIDPTLMPTSNRTAYFQARKKFFLLLNEAKEAPREREG